MDLTASHIFEISQGVRCEAKFIFASPLSPETPKCGCGYPANSSPVRANSKANVEPHFVMPYEKIMRGPSGCGGGFIMGFDMAVLEERMVNKFLKFARVNRC